MKTSGKISLIYSVITISLVVIAGIVFYLGTAHYTDSLYFQYMEEKGRVMAVERFAKDKLDSARYQRFKRKRANVIPTSADMFIEASDKVQAKKQLSAYFNDRQIRRVFSGKVVNFKRGNQVGTAFLYKDDDEGAFVVLILSRNPYGEDISDTIGISITILVLLSALTLYLISRLYAMRMLDRIDHDYETEKMFVNNASHEINNPLTSIQGECEVALIRERTPEQYRNSLQRIASDTDRIIHIMSELLKFSHSRSGKLDTTTFDRLQMSEFMQRYAGSQVRIQVDNDFTVYFEENLLGIAIGNLVNNSCKYSQGKPVTISIDRDTISITDQGIGIPEKELQHIFDPFFRASNATSVMGHGIGLALSREILERHKARIYVRSTEGKGTTFTVKFKNVK